MPDKSLPGSPHIYGFGTRLSSYYTMGRDGLRCPGHAGERDSEARKAYARGRADRKALAKKGQA